jgi:hypothetical protein
MSGEPAVVIAGMGRLRRPFVALHAWLSRRPELETWSLRNEWPWPVAVAVGLFLFYAWCSPRTIALEDDGLFVMASYFNGIAHPPGYPVFTLIGHLFSQLPFGSVAWRVHLVSALFGGLTCAVIWCIARSLVPSRPIATASALAYGFSEVFWSQAIIAEVYTLNTFITFLVVFMLLEMTRFRPKTPSVDAPDVDRTGALALGFVYGIGLSNHWPLLVLFSPAYLLLAWPVIGPLLRRSMALFVGLGLGLLPYLWLYLRSQMDPEISFFGPLEGWSEFNQFVSRSNYGSADHEPGVGWNDKVGYLGYLGRSALSQFTLLGAVVGLIGLLFPGRHFKTVTLLLLGGACVSLLLVLLLDREYSLLGTFVFRVYPLPAYGVVALLMPLGMFRSGQFFRELPTPALGRFPNATALVIVAILPLMVHAGQNLRGHYIWAERFARDVLDEIPQNGIMLLKSDIDALSIGYVHQVLGYREDVEIYGLDGLLFKNRLYDPWGNHDKSSKRKALEELIEGSGKEVCFVGLKGYFGVLHGLRWNGHTSCHEPGKEGVHAAISREAIDRYLSLQSSRDGDSWTQMAADAVDGQMVHVLIAESLKSNNQPHPYLNEALDRARFGLLGKMAFLRFSIQAGMPLTSDQSLALLEEAREKAGRAYTKRHLIELYQLEVRELRRAGRGEEAVGKLWAAVKLKPAWDNELLSDLLTVLFKSERRGDVMRVVELDSDFEILREIYDFFIENRHEVGFEMAMSRGELSLTIDAEGEFLVR